MSVEDLRRSFKPGRIRMLLVGESPPVAGSFFYRADSLLFRATRESFVEAFGPDVPDGRAFLEFFSGCGCYLDDLCVVPVDGLSDRERDAAWKEGIGPLAVRVAEFAPESVVCVFKGAKSEIFEAARRAGVDRQALHDLPFPLWYRRQYIEGLARLLQRYGITPGSFPQPPP